MKAHKTSIKLAGLYLAIMMAISLFFSVNLYHESSQEFDRDLRGQSTFINRVPDFGLTPDFRSQFLQDRQQYYRAARNRLLEHLVVTNLIILVGGGFLCYYLARRTLLPIEKAHDTQSRFTADASHELRTPIAAMQSEIEVALMDPKLTLETAKDRLKSNLEELSKLTVLSEGLLRLANLGTNNLEKQILPIKTIIDKAKKQVLPAAENKGIALKTTGLRAGIKVMADELSLIEAVVVILDNAIKYSAPSTKVNITVAKKQGDGVISIIDQGIGISEDKLPYIFDRFYQADPARSKQTSKGYGLGLAIAKNIIELHQGTITVASTLGKGSIFTIYLPTESKTN